MTGRLYTCMVRSVQAQVRGETALCTLSSRGEYLKVWMPLPLPAFSLHISRVRAESTQKHPQAPLSLLPRSINPKAFVFWLGWGEVGLIPLPT